MPIDRKFPDILHCAKCKLPWRKQARSALPRRCVHCGTTLWMDGTDHRERGKWFINSVHEGMNQTAEAIRNYPKNQQILYR